MVLQRKTLSEIFLLADFFSETLSGRNTSYGHENEMYNVGVSLKEVEGL